jgi:hypothetical protein
MRQKRKAEYENDRTQILRLMVEVGFHPLTPDTILSVMDESFHSLSAESLDFHLHYLADKGWIEIGEQKALGKDRSIVYAKVTAAGVEEYDRRCDRILKIRA